jgi:hypothetical protein
MTTGSVRRFSLQSISYSSSCLIDLVLVDSFVRLELGFSGDPTPNRIAKGNSRLFHRLTFAEPPFDLIRFQPLVAVRRVQRRHEEKIALHKEESGKTNIIHWH